MGGGRSWRRDATVVAMPPAALPTEPFTRAALAELGLTAKLLRAKLSSGEVRRLLHGVYADAAIPDTIDLRIAAASLCTAPGHVLIDRSAAWVHGVDAFAAAELAAGAPIESCLPPGAHPSERAGVDGHNRNLCDDDVMTVGTVSVTTPLRTSLDLGCHLRRREAYAAMCELHRLHGIGPRDLRPSIGRFRGRRGVIQLRSLVPLVDDRFESPREAWTYLAIADAGLPLPQPQWWVEVDGVPTYRLDLAYPLARVCVEYDGYDAHSTEQQRRHDGLRRAWLRRHGWTVIVVGSGDFTGAALDQWLRQLRQALASPYTSRRW